jgi:cytochrome d ubiquinol oxidase subunit I
MKMAAAEALCDTEAGPGFSVFAIGDVENRCDVRQVTIPGLTAWMATGDTGATLQGVRDLQEEYTAKYGRADYVPILPITYWSFRLMIGLGVLAAAAGALVLWLTRRDRVPAGRFWVWMALSLPLLPVVANSFGWIFTEMGRQPWAVFGLMTTASAVSPGVSVGEALTSVIVLTLVYAALAVVEVGLMLKYVRAGAEPIVDPPDPKLGEPSDEPLAFAY